MIFVRLLNYLLHDFLRLALLFSPSMPAGLVVKQYRFKILLVGPAGKHSIDLLFFFR